MMPPKQQIKAALAILAPPRRLHVAVREEVEYVIAEFGVICRNKEAAKPPSGQIRKKLRSIRASLQKSQNIANELSQLDIRWALFRLDLHEAIARCDRQLREPAGPKRRSADREKFAVHYARYLIAEFGDKKDLAVTRGNKWHKLSAVLLGDEGANLYRHMRALKDAVRPDLGRK